MDDERMIQIKRIVDKNHQLITPNNVGLSTNRGGATGHNFVLRLLTQTEMFSEERITVQGDQQIGPAEHDFQYVSFEHATVILHAALAADIVLWLLKSVDSFPLPLQAKVIEAAEELVRDRKRGDRRAREQNKKDAG